MTKKRQWKRKMMTQQKRNHEMMMKKGQWKRTTKEKTMK